MLLKGERETVMAVLMRRQYLPPMCDAVQDIVLMFKCPTRMVGLKDDVAKVTEEDLRHEAHLVADTLGPMVNNMSLYTDLIQSKLDALLFDEEGYAWAWSRLRLRPRGANNLEVYSHLFVKGVVKILRDESVLTHPQIFDEVSRMAEEVGDASRDEALYDFDPLVIALQKLRCPADGSDWTPNKPLNDKQLATGHGWHARVARYLGYCLDGGLLPGKFAIRDILDTLTHAVISDDATSKLDAILAFLLYARPKDIRKPWKQANLVNSVASIGVVESTFNDRILQVLLEWGFVKAKLMTSRSVSDGTPVVMTGEYAALLNCLLQSDAASLNIKASICRQIIKEAVNDHGPTLCPGLVALLRDGSLFLATYACAALVNLSQANEQMKSCIMKSGVGDICVHHLKSRDDDLVLYTLMLLVHLTKLAHHRLMMKQAGLMPVLNDILSAIYAAVRYKRRCLTEICSVIGQMCNDEDTRRLMCDNYQVVDCLLVVFESDVPHGPAANNAAVEDKGLYTVVAHSARGLRNADRGSLGTSDVYCQVTLESNGKVKQQVKTQTLKDNLEPRWDEAFKMEACSSDQLVVEVFDEDIGKTHDSLGKISIPISGRDGEFVLGESGQGTDAKIVIKIQQTSSANAAPTRSTLLTSKVMFALKQLCVNSPEHKEQVGIRVITSIVNDLGQKQNLENKDWAVNALMLLLLLSISKTCCQQMAEAELWARTFRVLSASEIGTMDATRDRLRQLDERIKEASKSSTK